MKTPTTNMSFGRMSTILAMVIFVQTLSATHARSWHDLIPKNALSPPSPFDWEELTTEVNPLRTAPPALDPSRTAAPTPSPTDFPTEKPTTLAPISMAPVSAAPTLPPTPQPTKAPTASPSLQPSPEPDQYPFNEPPALPKPWYFNYDTRPGALYGPGNLGLEIIPGQGFISVFKNNQWAERAIDPDYDWKEFDSNGSGAWKGVLANHMPLRNRCGRVGLQSPIDVRDNGLRRCEETHEVRSLPGDFRLSGDKVHKEILPNKLRFRYERRPCGDWDDVACAEPDPPHADFPNGWGGFADVMHVDFKVPSEHLLNGKRYDAELQIFHLHSKRRRMPTQATLIEAKANGFNWYFDEALQAFEYEFKRDKIICESSKRRERRMLSKFYDTLKSIAVGGRESHLRGSSNNNAMQNATKETSATVNTSSLRSDPEFLDTWGQYSIDSDAPGYKEQDEKDRQRILQRGVWDPHHELIVPSIHFYRYDGSLTEPPCGEWVSWFVTDKPMTISFEQLDTLKNLLFNYEDRTCQRTSVHFEQSVARPVQETGNRPVYLCTELDFGPDP